MNDKNLLELFTDMTRVHTAYVERRLLPLGLRTGQGAIISALGANGPCSQKDLAEYRHVSAATISVMLRRMEKVDLIERSQSEDGKGNIIMLTDKGQQAYQALSRDMVGEPERIFEGLAPEDKQAAERIFRQVAENLVGIYK